jgi:hypothetical protein
MVLLLRGGRSAACNFSHDRCATNCVNYLLFNLIMQSFIEWTTIFCVFFIYMLITFNSHSPLNRLKYLIFFMHITARKCKHFKNL